MEKQIDAQVLLTRVTEVAKELRKSEAYPAIVGGIAGGLAGTLMAIIIAGRRPTRTQSTLDDDATAAKARGGLALRDLMQLVPVIVSLVKQVQEWTKKQNEK